MYYTKIHNMQRDMEYENENFIYDKQSIGDDYYVIKCKNYETCKEVLSQDWFEKHNNYLCSVCQSKKSITNKSCRNCSHLCNDDNLELGERPEFPYPELIDEYKAHRCREMESSYPLIRQYNEDLRKWRIRKSREENKHKICPFCRR